MKNLQTITNQNVNGLADLLKKSIDVFEKIEISKILLKLSCANTAWRGLYILQETLKKNVITMDESLKSNDFSIQENYLINITIIDGISKVKDEK